MSIDERLLREALRLQPAEDEEGANDLAIEKMADEAFDWILNELRGGALTPHESVRGLRLLARLTRQFCVGRRGELLDLSLTLAVSPSSDGDVRSAALHVAIMGARIARGLRNASMAYGRSVHDIDVQVSEAIRRAVDLGLAPEVETFAKEFLHTRRMTADQGMNRLVFHGQPGAGSFLDMLRPYRGLRDEVLLDVMDALRACAPKLSDDQVPQALVSALWGISYLGRSWALEPGGMLRRNQLITDVDQAKLAAFLERFDYAVMMLLQGVPEEEAFGAYRGRRG